MPFSRKIQILENPINNLRYIFPKNIHLYNRIFPPEQIDHITHNSKREGHETDWR